MENARASRQPNRFPAAPTHANKTVNYGGFEAKALFDDVYGGPPKFGISTLSPRAEDYSEIFESFHSSRASSIPVLDLPAVDESEVFFDVRSSSLDYAEVFGDFDGLDCAVSYEELLFDQYKGGDRDSSDDEAWTPAGSGYLSDASDHSEKNHCFSNGDFCQPFDGDVEMSYHKANQTSSKDMCSGATHMTELDAVPGYTLVLEEIDRMQKTDENPILQMTDDDNLSMDFSVGMIKGKHLKKTMSQPFNDATCRQTFGNDLKPEKAYARSGSLSNEMFVTVSDISLRTQPSQLPPPSRPPPSTDVTKEVSSRLTSNSKSIASEGSEGDSSPPFFDVELDASSSAAAMNEAMTKAQIKLRSAKEFMERKEGFQGSAKMGSKNHIIDKEGKMSKIVDECDSLRNDGVQSTCNREDNAMKFSVREETQKVRKVAQDVPDSMEGEKLLQAAKKSAEKKHSKEYWSSLGPVKIEGSSDWKEVLQSIELVRTVKSGNALEQSNHIEISVHNAKTHEQGWEKNADLGVFELQEEENKKVMSAIGKHDLEYEKKSEVENEVWEGEEKGEEECSFQVLGGNERSKAAKEAQHKKKVKEAQVVFEKVKNEKKVRIAQKHKGTENKSTGSDVSENYNDLVEVQKEKYKSEVEQAMNHKEKEQKLKEANKRMEGEEIIRGLCGKEDNEKSKNKTFEVDENVRGHEEPLDGAEDGKNVKEALEHKGMEKRLKQEANERDENQKNKKDACKTQEHESILKEDLEQEEKTKLLRNIVEQEVKTKLLQNIVEREEHEKRLKEGLEEKDDEKQREFHKEEKNEKKQQETYQIIQNEKRLKDACAKEEKNLYGASEQEDKSEKLKGAQEGGVCGRRSKERFELEKIEKESTEASIWKESEKRLKDAGGKELNGLSEVHEQSERDENGKTLKLASGTCVRKELEDLGVSDGAWNLDDSENLQAPELASKDNKNGGKLEETQESLAHEQKKKTESELKDKEKDTELVENADARIGDKFKASDIAQGDLGLKGDQSRMEDATKSPPLDDNAKKIGEPGFSVRQTHIYKSLSQVDSFPINQEGKIVHELGDTGNNVKQAQPVLNQEESKDRSLPTQVRKDWVENGKKIEAARPAVLEVKENIQKGAPHVNARQTRERQEKKLNETATSEDKEMERVKRERELEMDRLRKMEEEREREREREKDRMAVDRKTLETRERAYTEARDKAERAAVERAMAEARERLEKACAEAREKTFSEKSTVEARLRAERAAVERATAEARERAVERAMAEKAAFGMRERVERSVSDKFPAYVRNNEIKQSSSFSFYGAAYPTEQSEGVEGESPQRCKARLERYQRTTERAAKALAEKNMRDLLAQREQAERNRLAETLDADVRRWSSGKEGNLRALLSTLQYHMILHRNKGLRCLNLAGK
ncbi:hypothetical protein I3760_01G041100 [Carya illinoinensis]|nr:hypothetical protein I3760_01G041100 [Carya illinoinensis]